MIPEKLNNYEALIKEINNNITLSEQEWKNPETTTKISEFLSNNQDFIAEQLFNRPLYDALMHLSERLSQYATSGDQHSLSHQISQLAQSLFNLEKMPREILTKTLGEVIDPSSTTKLKGLASSSLVSKTFKTAADQAKIEYMSISTMPPEKIQEFESESRVASRTLFKSITRRSDLSPFFYGGYSYEETLGRMGKVLTDDLSQLGAQDVYLDSGCGDGAAIIEYRTVFPQGASVVGISATRPNQEKISALIQKEKEDKKFSYCLCDFNNFPTSHLEGKVSIMTDIFGVLRYGCNPTRFIEQAGKLLKPGGKLYIIYAWADGIIIPKDGRFNYLNRPDSNDLFGLWFYTIKGFDVLEPEKSLEESRAFQENCFKDEKNLSKLRINQESHRLILVRNKDPVQADTLIAHPYFANEVSEKAKNFDYWCPSYTWEMSDYTNSLFANKHIRLYL
jgi:SAM-dependent methyltransferase